MAGSNGDEVVRTRIDASSARLTSLRTTAGTDTNSAGARRPKFVPKAAKRRAGTEGQPEGDAVKTEGHARESKPPRGDFVRDRGSHSGRGGGGGFGGRGGRGGRGRGGRGMLPTGKVTFVGTLSGGSSYSTSGAAALPRSTNTVKSSAADGLGISVLDDEDGVEPTYGGIHSMHVEEQWPPVVKSAMEPMALPVARQPEPESTGAVFCDVQTGQLMLPDDSLLFIQLPTTLPLGSVTTTTPKSDEDDDAMGETEQTAPKSNPARTTATKSDESTEKTIGSNEQLFDNTLMTAPGGFIGKLVIRKSGKTMLVLGDKQFDVATAQTPSFCEEIYSIDPTEQQLCMLGGVERHLVVTPDFDTLLA